MLVLFQCYFCCWDCVAALRHSTVIMKWWFNLLSKIWSIMQLINLQTISVIVKIKLIMLIWFLSSLMIVLVNVKKIKFISFMIYIRSFVMLWQCMHLTSFHIEWWTLKFSINRCLPGLHSSCCKLYMRDSLLMFHKNLRSGKYTLWIYSVMFSSFRISVKRSDIECFIV